MSSRSSEDIAEHSDPLADSLDGESRSKTDRICSHLSLKSRASKDVAPPPDGGLNAWIQVLAGFLAVFNSSGYTTTFGVFQAYYTTVLPQPASAISWIGSVQLFLIYFLSAFSGRAVDAGYYRASLTIGLALQVLGVFATSTSTTYWQLFLAQGVCHGFGAGLVFCPANAVVATYFHRRRAVALSCIAAGAGTGSVIFPFIARELLYSAGFSCTLRVMGWVMLSNTVVILSLASPRIAPRVAGPLIEWEAFGESSYVLFVAGSFMAYMIVFVGYYYITPYARDIIHVSYNEALNILLTLNAMGIPGRLIPGFLADQFLGPANTYISFVLISGILIYCWTAATSLNGVWTFAIFYGFFAAGVQSLLAPSLASISPDLSKMGVRLGMVFTIVSVGAFIGPPLAGVLIENDDGRYLYAQLCGGSVMLCGAFFISASRVAQTGWRLRVKC